MCGERGRSVWPTRREFDDAVTPLEYFCRWLPLVNLRGENYGK